MSCAWIKLNEKTGLLVGVDRNGDRFEKRPTDHQCRNVERWGRNENKSLRDEEENQR